MVEDGEEVPASIWLMPAAGVDDSEGGAGTADIFPGEQPMTFPAQHRPGRPPARDPSQTPCPVRQPRLPERHIHRHPSLPVWNYMHA